MNRVIQEKWSWIDSSHAMRAELLDALSDADLGFNPGGQNMTLGALFCEIGEIEHSYVQSLKTFKQDWAYRNTEQGIENSIGKLKAWYRTLDDQMKATVAALSNEDLNKPIERSGGNFMPVEMQLDLYLQALLIFFGKATICLKALNKPLPENVREYIG
jgi:uncharacterized damage-inducible protein DinB